MRRWTILFLATLLLFMLVAPIQPVFAETTGDWISDGLPVAPDMSINDGSTSDKAIQISTASELAWISEQVNSAATTGTTFSGKYIKLTGDIDLTGHYWVPIGYNYDYPFEGDFDGGGYTINGLNINDSGAELESIGLFGRAYHGSISNLYIADDGVVTSSRNGGYIGVIVGDFWDGTLANLHNGADVTSNGLDAYVGGIYGFADTYTVLNCSNSGTITAIDGEVGGIAGGTGGGYAGFTSTLESCVNTGDIISYHDSANDNTESPTAGEAGGIVGSQNNKGEIRNCYNSGKVTLHGGSSDAISYGGGIAGTTRVYSSPAKITYCYNTGDVEGVTGLSVVIGGIVGGNNDTIENCVNLSQTIIASEEGAIVQRIAGFSDGNLTWNYSWSGTEVTVSDIPVAPGEGLNSTSGENDSIETLLTYWASGENWTEGAWDSDIWTMPAASDTQILPILAGNEADQSAQMPSYMISTTPAVEDSSVAKTEEIPVSVYFTLTNEPAFADDQTWNVYTYEDSSYTRLYDITASNIGNTLILHNATDMPLGTYFVGLVESGMAESDRLELTVTAPSVPVAPTITTDTLVAGTVGTSYSQSLNATGDAIITWSIGEGALPDGLTLTGSVISGTPTVAGSFTFIVAATNDTGTDSQELTIQIQATETQGGGGSGRITTTTDTDKSQVTISGQTQGGSTTGTVTEGEMTTAINQVATREENVELTIVAPAGATNISLTIPDTSIATLEESGLNGLTIDTPIASLILDNKALGAISDAASGSVTISVAVADASKLSVPAAVLAKLEGRPIYDFTITSGDKTISNFQGGTATVVLPYALRSGENPNSIVVYYLDDKGNLKPVKGVFDSVTGTVKMVISHFSSYVVGYNPVEFKDVTGIQWYAEAVGFVTARELFTGMGEGTFEPLALMTRGMFAQVLYNLEGLYATTAPSENFKDVSDHDWYAVAVNWAVENDIITGYGDGRFGPEDKITRAQMAVMLNNYLTYKGATFAKVNEKPFADEANLPKWAQEGVAQMRSYGLVKGLGENRFDPAGRANRAEVASLYMNLVKAYLN